MITTHEAILTTDDDRPFTVEDPAPLESATLFKVISDQIWDQRQLNIDTTSWSTTANLDAEQALNEVTTQLKEIDEKFDISSGEEDLKLTGRWNESVEIARSKLITPRQSTLTTFNWDAHSTIRIVYIDDERHVAQFSDGHRDYSRELEAKFWFTVDDQTLIASYSMQRHQYDQDIPTSVSASIWYSHFAETGYEGSGIFRAELSEEKELTLLQIFARIGGISLDDQYLA